MTYDNDPSHNIPHIHHVQSKWYDSEVIYELTTFLGKTKKVKLVKINS